MFAANHEKKTRGPSCFVRKAKDMKYITSSGENYNKKLIDCVRIKPTISINFSVGNESFISQGCHTGYLPYDCDLVSLNTHGTVINNEETQEDNDNIACMLFPEVPNINVSMYTFNIHNWKRTKKVYPLKFKSMFKVSDKDPETKCMILLCDWNGRVIASNILRALKNGLKASKTFVWGGIAKNLIVCATENNKRTCKRTSNCAAITIIGTKMKVWTILLDSKCNTKKLVEDKLKAFKEEIQLKRHSIGFMFACCVRGLNMFDEPHVESTIFKALFPKVPLVGCFGDGEFGKRITNEKSRRKRWQFVNSVSTSFMILTYDT
ncbi:PREDICTED: F-box only protein 22-like isoform X2 [Polistes dominula]|uniref:F-box only protein 22-like isoform X2 n=1 Tax=Polistes dominula TaxID=743375 RepID=A0ABM1HYT8_POLDO|nr:PREDICTED: F-box only protein 22-like isoform X2 [Polistes dominula]